VDYVFNKRNVTFGTPGTEEFRALRTDTYNNLYTCGGPTLVKWTCDLEQVWNRTVEGAVFEALWIDGSGNVYVGGAITSPQRVFLVCWSPEGEEHWNVTLPALYDTSSWRGVWGSVQDACVFTFGTLNDTLFLVKWDYDGNQVANVSAGGDGAYNLGNDVHTYGDNLVVGVSTIDFGTHMEVLLSGWDFSLTSLWNRTYRGTMDFGAAGNSVCVHHSGIYVAGYTYGSGSLVDILVLKTDLNGNLGWDQAWHIYSTEEGNCVSVANDCVFVSGYAEREMGGNEFVLSWWDLAGNRLGFNSWGGAQSDLAYAHLVMGDSVVVVGATSSFGAGSKDGAVVVWEKNHAPQVASVEDITMVVGEKGRSVTWLPLDLTTNGPTYRVFINDTQVVYRPWVHQTTIRYVLDGLAVGDHLIRLQLNDGYGLLGESELVASVRPADENGGDGDSDADTGPTSLWGLLLDTLDSVYLVVIITAIGVGVATYGFYQRAQIRKRRLAQRRPHVPTKPLVSPAKRPESGVRGERGDTHGDDFFS
jgi:hypothetical protein